MTTAHRPTWHNALGGDSQGGNRLLKPTAKRSARDQPGELRLKSRVSTQLPPTKDRGELARQLELKEAESSNKQKKGLLTLSSLPAVENPFPEDADDVEAPAGKGLGFRVLEEGEGTEESEDEDEEAELLRELEKIKKERAEKDAAAARQLEQQKKEEQQERMLRANPLLLEGEGAP